MAKQVFIFLKKYLAFSQIDFQSTASIVTGQSKHKSATSTNPVIVMTSSQSCIMQHSLICANCCPGVTCSGHGDCEPVGVYGHMCHCSVGYTGRDCITAVCASQPCLHDSLCHMTDNGRGYVCECVAGWAGVNCETGRLWFYVTWQITLSPFTGLCLWRNLKLSFVSCKQK